MLQCRFVAKIYRKVKYSTRDVDSHFYLHPNVQTFHISETWVTINYSNIHLDSRLSFLTLCSTIQTKNNAFIFLISWSHNIILHSISHFFFDILLTFILIFFFTVALLRTTRSKNININFTDYSVSVFLEKQKNIWNDTDKHKNQCSLWHFSSPWKFNEWIME